MSFQISTFVIFCAETYLISEGGVADYNYEWDPLVTATIAYVVSLAGKLSCYAKYIYIRSLVVLADKPKWVSKLLWTSVVCIDLCLMFAVVSTLVGFHVDLNDTLRAVLQSKWGFGLAALFIIAMDIYYITIFYEIMFRKYDKKRDDQGKSPEHQTQSQPQQRQRQHQRSHNQQYYDSIDAKTTAISTEEEKQQTNHQGTNDNDVQNILTHRSRIIAYYGLISITLSLLAFIFNIFSRFVFGESLTSVFLNLGIEISLWSVVFSLTIMKYRLNLLRGV